MQSEDGSERVAVPTHLFKVVLHERPNGFVENIAIFLPHTDESITGHEGIAYLTNHITTIDEIAALTGIDFLTATASESPAKEAEIESHAESALLPRN
jgi:hypothetical protein